MAPREIAYDLSLHIYSPPFANTSRIRLSIKHISLYHDSRPFFFSEQKVHISVRAAATAHSLSSLRKATPIDYNISFFFSRHFALLFTLQFYGAMDSRLWAEWMMRRNAAALSMPIFSSSYRSKARSFATCRLQVERAGRPSLSFRSSEELTGSLLFDCDPNFQFFIADCTKRPIASIAVVNNRIRRRDAPVRAVTAHPSTVGYRK